MATQKVKRQRLSDLLHAQIDSKLTQSLRTVYNINKTIDMGNGIQRKPSSVGVNKKWNRDFIDALKTKIAKDPTTSIRKKAAELKVKPKTVRTAVHGDLDIESYTRIHRVHGSQKAGKVQESTQIYQESWVYCENIL